MAGLQYWSTCCNLHGALAQVCEGSSCDAAEPEALAAKGVWGKPLPEAVKAAPMPTTPLTMPAPSARPSPGPSPAPVQAKAGVKPQSRPSPGPSPAPVQAKAGVKPQSAPTAKEAPAARPEKVGRNTPCPCQAKECRWLISTRPPHHTHKILLQCFGCMRPYVSHRLYNERRLVSTVLKMSSTS